MDRRTLLAAAACLTTLPSTSAKACSVALKNPGMDGRQNQQIVKLFQAWWERDEDRFRSYFTTTLMNDGSLMDTELAKELRDADPIDPSTFGIFAKHFTIEQNLQRLVLIVNTEAGVLVGCSEHNLNGSISADCSGMPEIHLFFVIMQGLNPRSISHIATEGSATPGKFSIWSGDS